MEVFPMKWNSVAIGILFLLLNGVGPAQSPKQSQQAHPATTQKAQSDSEAGQQVFQRNCSRCHKAPEGLPPSISGTVALHMRVRAGLSEKDYKKLLAFLNP
jgi:cytochrome c5